jgi:hypothetical protein
LTVTPSNRAAPAEAGALSPAGGSDTTGAEAAGSEPAGEGLAVGLHA